MPSVLNSPNVEADNLQQQFGDANPDGVTFGASASDKISFYGKIPHTQRVVANLSLLTSSSASGTATNSLGTAAWGAYSTSSSYTGGTATSYSYTQSSYQVSAYATATMGSVLTEVVNTLVGLGLWKATSA